MNSELNNPGVWPCLLYRDADAAREFLTTVLGFTETVTVRGDEDSNIVHAEAKWPEGGGVMYGPSGQHGEGMPEPVIGSQCLYVVTEDPDAVHKRVQAAGATVLSEPYEADYGSRNVTIADLEGNVWTFGTYRGA